MASRAELAAQLQFDGPDLDSNRAGLISSAQHQRLWRRDLIQLLASTGCILFGIVFNVALFAGWMGTVRGRGAGLGAGVLLVGLIVGYASSVLWLDLLAGRVGVARGDVEVDTTSGRGGKRYFVTVGGVRLQVPIEVQGELADGAWTVYYLPRTRTVLSVEEAGPARSG